MATEESSTQGSIENISESEVISTESTGVKKQLDELKEERKRKQEEIQSEKMSFEKLQKETEQLSKNITELEAAMNEVDKTVDTYGKALENIKTEITTIEDYYNTKWPQIELANRDKKEEIEKAIQKVDDIIKEIKKRLDELDMDGVGEIATTQKEFDEAQKSLIASQKKYDELKNIQKMFEGKINELKDLKKSIETEEDKGNKENEYFLIKEIDKILEKYLFSWDKIPGQDEESLKNFLKQNYGIDWLTNADFKKSDEHTIRANYENKSLSLKLNNKKTNVTLKIDNHERDTFIAKTEDDELKVYKKLIIKTKKELEGELSQAWMSLKSAKTISREAEAKLNYLKEEQKTKQKNLEDAIKNRNNDIYDEINKIKYK